MKILNILDLRKVNPTKIIKFQEKFELEVPIWANFVTIDKTYTNWKNVDGNGKFICLFCWEKKPYYDNFENIYYQNDNFPDSEYTQLQYSVVVDGKFEPMLKTIYEIRRDILNMPIDMWNKFEVEFGKMHYRGTAEWFLKNIGLPGSLSAKCNEQETEFFKEIYRLNREINNER